MSASPSRSGSRWEPESTAVEPAAQPLQPGGHTVAETSGPVLHRPRRVALMVSSLVIVAVSGLGGFVLGQAADDAGPRRVAGTGVTVPSRGDGSYEADRGLPSVADDGRDGSHDGSGPHDDGEPSESAP